MSGCAKTIKALAAPCMGPGRTITGFLRSAASPVTLPLSSLIPCTRIPGFPISFIDSATRSRTPTEDPPVVKMISLSDSATLILFFILSLLSGVIPRSRGLPLISQSSQI